MASSDGGTQPLHPQVTVRLNAERRAQLKEMVDYIAGIHHHIDPLRFDIDLAFLETLRTLVSQDGWEDTPMIVSYHETLVIENIADAAGTYSERGHPPFMDGVSSDDCLEFIEWFTKATRGLYQPPGRPS